MNFREGSDVMKSVLAAAVLALVLLVTNDLAPAAAQSTAALGGQVTSAEQGPMEGVLVSARKAGSTITVTVVSDARGSYSFPAARLEPGRYSLRIRAVGYDLEAPANVDVGAGAGATYDLKLRKTEDLAGQLSNRASRKPRSFAAASGGWRSAATSACRSIAPWPTSWRASISAPARNGATRSRRCRARRAAAHASSSPNTISRAKPSSRTT